MLVAKEETFGPIIPILKVQSDEQAVELINDSNYGLTASVWTRDVSKGRELGNEIEAGTVFVNRADCPNPVSSAMDSSFFPTSYHFDNEEKPP